MSCIHCLSSEVPLGRPNGRVRLHRSHTVVCLACSDVVDGIDKAAEFSTRQRAVPDKGSDMPPRRRQPTRPGKVRFDVRGAMTITTSMARADSIPIPSSDTASALVRQFLRLDRADALVARSGCSLCACVALLPSCLYLPEQRRMFGEPTAVSPPSLATG